MAPAFTAARIVAARGGSRRSNGGRRHGSRFLVTRLADQHGPCHQQERSIHEDSSNWVKVWPRFGILETRGTPPASCLTACALFVMKRKPLPSGSPVCPGGCRLFFLLSLSFGQVFILPSQVSLIMELPKLKRYGELRARKAFG